MERAQFWKGLAIGIAATLLAAVLIMLVSLTVMSANQDAGGIPPMNGARHEDPPTRRETNGGMMDPDGMMGGGRMMDGMPPWMMSRPDTGAAGGGPEMMRDMRTIRQLLTQHEKIERYLWEIPGGVRAVTTSEDPQVAQAIRTHVRQMKERLEQGQPIRMMDPLFRELFRHHEKINIQVEEVPGGVRVTETSQDPQVTALIRQHANRAVSEFVERGMPRAMEPTPLPPGYETGR